MPTVLRRGHPSRSRQAGPILVVEDDRAIRAFVCMVLESEGHAVVAAADGAAALEAVRDLLPAVILLDMRMPIMDGWAFAQAYRQEPPPHAPIIACTAMIDADICAAEIGAEASLGKPFDGRTLLATVSPYVERTRRRRAGGRS